MTPTDFIRVRPCAGERDLAAMYDVAAIYPDVALHLADLPWRFSSPPFSVPDQTRLWEDAAGKLLAWTYLSTWNCVDDFVRPGPHADQLALSILDWAIDRQHAEASATGERRTLYVTSRSEDPARIARLERRGFVRDSWHDVHLARDLTTPIPEPALPPGFTIRPLDGERDVDTYVAMHRTAFGTNRMTAAWRRATLRDPHYEPNLDLVAVAPDGILAAFCVCWITPPLPSRGGARIAQVEPMGVQPDYRRLGLGRALLHEGFRRARGLGADRMEVDAFSFSEPALRAYESVGFCRVYDELVFGREFS
jgi:GNAT superfamily N-acetyltransferase